MHRGVMATRIILGNSAEEAYLECPSATYGTKLSVVLVFSSRIRNPVATKVPASMSVLREIWNV